MERRTIYDDLRKGFGSAITDIREKYEEAVWGRPVTERDDCASPQWPEAREVQPEPARQQEHDHGSDIDR